MKTSLFVVGLALWSLSSVANTATKENQSVCSPEARKDSTYDVCAKDFFYSRLSKDRKLTKRENFDKVPYVQIYGYQPAAIIVVVETAENLLRGSGWCLTKESKNNLTTAANHALKRNTLTSVVLNDIVESTLVVEECSE